MTFWNNINMLDANSPIMEQLIFFHDHTLLVMINIMMLISYMMIKIILNKYYNRFLYENHKMETIWTILPSIMLMFIAIPSLRLLYILDEMFSPSLNIKIMGHQWYWSYEYSEFNKEFDSFYIPEQNLNKNMFRLLDVDNRMILPFNLNTRLLVTSFDVIHSWTIPSLGVKIDAIPGRINQINFFTYRPGLYYGQCSEICGANHSFMPICVEITNMNNFFSWIKN
uniref:Cytochrome c oxidase subunit 2 n=1 Tax=Ptilonyssus chloris TaxID=2652178 RepID=A0A5Q0S0V9_9ACAR|nr:cytochrome c oxidase subunit II [Ptilonyssus chloris]QGA47499.1 cytochrome c oxidase subunit II [Ptilonyssus chloris]